MTTPATSPLDEADLRERVQAIIDAELRTRAGLLAEVGPEADDLVAAIERLLAGGKRLRAGFTYWGYRAGGSPDCDGAMRLATAMEFFQAGALIHDDVMDDSDTRRGAPAAHRALAGEHDRRSWHGDADRFGTAGAILAGNLCLGWTEDLYAGCGLPDDRLRRARPVFDAMRTQLMAGQYLDVVESVRPWSDLTTAERLERAERVIRFKSAKYSIEQPLLIGARAGGVGTSDLELLSAYGLDLGHAFQLRDDVLGVFGDPAETGKPAGDDLREGKRTVIIAHVLDTTDADGRTVVDDLLGRPDLSDAQVEQLRDVITSSGAVETVEAEITRLAGQARRSLADTRGLEPQAQQMLDALIEVATARST